MPNDNEKISKDVLNQFSLNRLSSLIQDIVHQEMVDWVPDLIEEGLENPVGTFKRDMHEQTVMLNEITKLSQDIKADTTYIRNRLDNIQKKNNVGGLGSSFAKFLLGGIGMSPGMIAITGSFATYMTRFAMVALPYFLRALPYVTSATIVGSLIVGMDEEKQKREKRETILNQGNTSDVINEMAKMRDEIRSNQKNLDDMKKKGVDTGSADYMTTKTYIDNLQSQYDKAMEKFNSDSHEARDAKSLDYWRYPEKGRYFDTFSNAVPDWAKPDYVQPKEDYAPSVNFDAMSKGKKESDIVRVGVAKNTKNNEIDGNMVLMIRKIPSISLNKAGTGTAWAVMILTGTMKGSSFSLDENQVVPSQGITMKWGQVKNEIAKLNLSYNEVPSSNIQPVSFRKNISGFDKSMVIKASYNVPLNGSPNVAGPKSDTNSTIMPSIPGGNSNYYTAPSSTTDNSSSPVVTGKGSVSDKALAFMQDMVSQGVSPEDAAAIAANVQNESGFNTSIEDYKKSGHYGYMQWSGQRLEGLKNYANSIGKDWTDPSIQRKWILMERSGESIKYGGSDERASYAKGLEGKNVAEKTANFAKHVERPSAAELASSEQRRVNSAASILQGYNDSLKKSTADATNKTVPDLKATKGRNPDLTDVDPALLDSLKHAAAHLPPGYTASINEGYNPNGHAPNSQHHIKGKGAIDLVITDPNRNQIPNSGADTTGLYTKLAQDTYGEMQARYPKKAGELAWGGAFDTSAGSGRPDLMHFDLGGERGQYTNNLLANLGVRKDQIYGKDGIYTPDQLAAFNDTNKLAELHKKKETFIPDAPVAQNTDPTVLARLDELHKKVESLNNKVQEKPKGESTIVANKTVPGKMPPEKSNAQKKANKDRLGEKDDVWI